MTRPTTRTVAAPDGVNVAYQVFGSGDVALVLIPGWISHLELNWDEPSFSSFLLRLAGFARVVVIDKRGTGCSERGRAVADLETGVDDLLAVLDAERIERTVLVGQSSGAGMAAMFAASHPKRTRALVLIGPRARTQWAADYPWGATPEEYAEELRLTRIGWDSGDYVRRCVAPVVVPSRTADEEFMERFVDYHRAASSAEDAVAVCEMWWEIDYRAVLPSISVPTLLLVHADQADEAAHLAGRIPGSHVGVLPGADWEMWAPANDAATEAIRTFLSAVHDEEADFQRVLATVVFTDIVDSTARASRLGDRQWQAIRREHDEITRSHLCRYRGNEVKTVGDGFLATFDGPARAIRCSLALAHAVRRLDIEIRAGVHTGEVEFDKADDVHGLAVAIAARVSSLAGASEVLVSQTVRDLVVGSGLGFADVGMHSLKGIPDQWQLFRALGPLPASPGDELARRRAA